MDQQRFLAVDGFDVGVWNTRLEVKYGICIEAEGFEDTINFSILQRYLVGI
jgi:hypothetical protein